MDSRQIKEILKRYHAGLCTDEERAWVEAWYMDLLDHADELNLEEADMDFAKQQIWDDITEKRPDVLTQKNQPKLGLRLYYRAAAAAVILFALGTAIYYINDSRTAAIPQELAHTEAIEPGGNKAYLTLVDGRKVDLTDMKDDMSVEQNGMQIVKSADGELVYKATNPSQTDLGAQGHNIIETPIGGEYKVQLPDGTKVWLNASSSLEYPVRFAHNERRVTLHGEGYFEVKPDKHRPFRVTTDKQTVEVLGTKFNINTYRDEPTTNTTLIEGSVRVSLADVSTVIKPGQQASVAQGNINVHEVDTKQVLAWHNGDFAFEGVELKVIMRQISRWYDIDVVYQNDIGNVKFGGSISRSKDIKEVLKVLSMTKGVNFKIEGRRVSVMR